MAAVQVADGYKYCKGCNSVKEYVEFSVNRATRDWRQYKCRSCDSAYQVRMRAENLESQRAKDRIYREGCKTRGGHDWRLKQLLNSAKARAMNKCMDFNLTFDDVKALYPADGMCPVYGFALEWNSAGFRDTSPSIDRIDSTKGYTTDNCQIISFKANRIKNDASVEDVLRLAQFLGGYSNQRLH